jgi:hypothetical protein
MSIKATRPTPLSCRTPCASISQTSWGAPAGWGSGWTNSLWRWWRRVSFSLLRQAASRARLGMRRPTNRPSWASSSRKVCGPQPGCMSRSSRTAARSSSEARPSAPVRGRPMCEARPLRPSPWARRRHLRTVAGLRCRARAICGSVSPRSARSEISNRCCSGVTPLPWLMFHLPASNSATR